MRSLRSRIGAALTALVLVVGSLLGTGAIALADTVLPPTNAAITPVEGDVGMFSLTWNAPAEGTVARYEIHRWKETDEEDTPSASIYTYVAEVNGNLTDYAPDDPIPTDGTYWFSVIAVYGEDESTIASQPSNWVSLEVDHAEAGADTTAPPAPSGLDLGDGFIDSRAVTLTWDEDTETADLWRYLIFRAEGDNARELIAYRPGTDNQYSDTVPADGTYSYYLMAQDTTGNISALSVGQRIVVDTVEPVVTITAPEDGRTYTGTGRLAITFSVEEEGAGYVPGAVYYSLNGTELSNHYIELEDLTNGLYTVQVGVTDKAGNTGWDTVEFEYDNGAPNDPSAPQTVTVPQYSKSRSVTVRWTAPTSTSGLENFLVYRTRNTVETLVATTGANARSYTDLVPADGSYSYRVAAKYSNNEEFASNPVSTTVDTVAPTITITAPENTNYDTAVDEYVAVVVDVDDATSGMPTDGTKYYLDGALFDADEIDLAALDDGRHTFRVEATDRAGNKAIKSVTFTVNGTGSGGDDDDDGDGRPARNRAMLSLLGELKDSIAPGHHAALSAFARNGNMKAFRHHLMKFGPKEKFFWDDAYERLLEELGDANETPGKGKARGRKW